MLICVPIQVKTQKEAIQKMRFLKGKTDLAELWLDSISDLDLPALFKRKPLPVICKGRKALEAAKLGADYIDLLFLGETAPKTCAKLILSHHDFKRTPSLARMLSLAMGMRRAGADIVKIAVMARSLADTLNVIFLAQELQRRGIAHILIAMGPHGRLSRVITPRLGGTIMFAPLKAGQANAPGQLTVRELKTAWNLIR